MNSSKADRKTVPILKTMYGKAYEKNTGQRILRIYYRHRRRDVWYILGRGIKGNLYFVLFICYSEVVYLTNVYVSTYSKCFGHMRLLGVGDC